MFELEDYSSGYHDGFLNKYADSSGPTLDFYVSDSLQDMLDIDIRSEIATVVGGSNELATLVSDLPNSFDHAMDAISASINSSSTLSNACSSFASTSTWLGASMGPSWSSSSTSDFYADVGACVNPISVMPLISSSLLHLSPKTNLNANGLRSATSPPPASPNASETAKSHLTFSPAQMKLSAGSIRHEQIISHIPKQIIAISSTVTAATTAPATLATNSALQRKSVAAVEAIKKDLGADLRRVSTSSLVTNESHVSGSILHTNGLLNGSTTTNTIKLAPGIGGLTFANSITYNKLKQQSAAKSALGSPVTANGTIVLKRDRDSSPLHNMATLSANGSGQNVKILSRNMVQSGGNGIFTPKSIASAHSPLMQNNVGSISSLSTGTSSALSFSSAATSASSFSAGLIPITSSSNLSAISTSSSSSSSGSSSLSGSGSGSAIVKPLHQKIKATPIESEFPKPAYSYSCLIAMALKNSRSGSLPVSEIYSFMCEHFPYFKTAPPGWKNSVRHNLSLNKCFEKIEKPATNGSQRKGCLWAMNPERIAKMDEEVQKWSRKDPMAIRNAMVFPEHLDALERGEMKHGSLSDSDVELDSQSEIEETSDLEEQELDETIVDNMFVEEDIEEEAEDMLGVVINAASRSMSGCGGGDEVVSVPQQHRDFDIEVSLETHMIEKASLLYEKVEDIYDAIDLEDDKEAVRMAIIQSDIIELSPADLNAAQNGYQSPKRARLNINYSIGPAGELEKQIQQQNIKQIRVQQAQSLQHVQHHQLQQHHHQPQQQKQQHIVVQTIATNGNTISTSAHNTQKFQQMTAIPHHNRRKMQLVNRIV